MEKEEASNTFLLPPVRTHCWFNVFHDDAGSGGVEDDDAGGGSNEEDETVVLVVKMMVMIIEEKKKMVQITFSGVAKGLGFWPEWTKAVTNTPSIRSWLWLSCEWTPTDLTLLDCTLVIYHVENTSLLVFL